MTHTANGSTRAIRPGAEPFFYERGPVAVLMIHGFGGAPDELHSMGQFLADAGYSTRGLLLPHHGGQMAELSASRWQEWAAFAEQEFRALQARYTQVALVGFSMGALLALYVAARNTTPGLVLLAPALRLRNERQLGLSAVGKYVLPWLYPLQRANFADERVRASIRAVVPDVDLDDPNVVAALRKEVRISTGALHELIRLKQVVARNLWRVNTSLLVLQGRNDQTVDPAGAPWLLEQVRSKDKTLRWFESGHMLPRDGDTHPVWSAAGEWLAQHT